MTNESTPAELAEFTDAIAEIGIAAAALICALRPPRGPARVRFEKALRRAIRSAPPHSRLYPHVLATALDGMPPGVLPRPRTRASAKLRRTPTE